MKRRLPFALAILAVFPLHASDKTAAPASDHAECGVVFHTEDRDLQNLFDAAEKCLVGNRVRFTPDMEVLVEGGGYPNAWIETQPMGGEMYAKRNLRVALNNQRIFLMTQREDGRLPGMVISGATARAKGWDQAPPEGHVWFPDAGLLADFEMFQGFCFPEPAWRMYHWTGKDKAYLRELHAALVAHDAYLWRTRDSNDDGILETWCVWDTGEDHANRLTRRWAPNNWPFESPPGTPDTPDPADPKSYGRYWGHKLPGGQKRPTREDLLVPFASMDVMAYSYNARATLALVSAELGDGQQSRWQAHAAEVRKRLIDHLWDSERHACFDRDRHGNRLPELIHNNLRCMWYGIFTQQMANDFVQYHLMNPQEFWTPMPLVSVAVNDPLYENAPGNNWSGQPQGLTYQRAIGALERYGHFAEVTLLADKLLPALIGNKCRFSQQLDATTGEPSGQKPDGYGPMALAALEYLSRTRGIHLDVANSRVWWSSAEPEAVEFTYAQRWGADVFTLHHRDGGFEAFLNQSLVFRASAGVRVVTDLGGKIIELHGISPSEQVVELELAGRTSQCVIAANEVLHFPDPSGIPRKSKVPFTSPVPTSEP